YPAARTTLTSAKGEEVEVKIYETRKVLDNSKAVEPGTVISDGKNSLAFATTDGLLEIVELQQAGKKRMPAVDFLRGFHLAE
ncbi:MAG: methionyl-tRNA formyltransferase, partial [Bacteroidaceae bacterium]|nr:methionyl-tRNA formyltransferase [Bacteroidaceae bacterium]